MSAKPSVYLIPGLGADKRMYLPQLAVWPHARVLEHVYPITGQTLADYAERLIPLINTREPFIIIGTSLGGMVAIELAAKLKPHKTILLASVKSREELPLFIRSMKLLKLHKLLSGNTFKKFNELAAERLNSRGDAAIAALIKQMADDTDPDFIEWAINAVINWQPPAVESPVIHIHGDNDMLFPISRIKNALPVAGGSHVMNLSQSEAVNSLLLQALAG
ncbi:MAG: alpha/beta hydrolase [Chitinophagales bacterium]